MPLDEGQFATKSAITALAHVARLMDGYLSTQLLYLAAKLGLADALAAGPKAADALASAVGASPDALRRVLRGLAAEGVLEELPGDHFGLTALGHCLRPGIPGSLHGAIVARGDLYFRAAAGLLEAVCDGGVAFERVYGSSFFDYLSQHPERAAEFQQSMADRSWQEAADVVAAYDFRPFRRLVDVGGGTGILLAAILGAAPALHGLLFDRPAVVDRARERLAATGLASRCEVVGGDFFAGLPPGGDVYLLSRVLHDWDDAAAERILSSCRRAMDAGGTLLLVEAVLPERAREQPAVTRMDLHMFLLSTGRERTAAEFERLLVAGGFQMRRILPTGSPAGISLVEAVPRT
jgi:hypothetical protein